MLLKQLNDDDKRVFLCLAELLILADKPLLCNGKRRETRTNSGNATISLRRDEREAQMLEELASISTNSVNGPSFRGFLGLGLFCNDIEQALIKRIEPLSFDMEDNPAVRVGAASEILREVLKGKGAAIPSIPKLMLYELMMLAMTRGSISSVQWQLLNEFKHHYQLEDYVFSDLLQRAQQTYLETQKTIAIIFE